jgi:hypothetical protein
VCVLRKASNLGSNQPHYIHGRGLVWPECVPRFKPRCNLPSACALSHTHAQHTLTLCPANMNGLGSQPSAEPQQPCCRGDCVTMPLHWQQRYARKSDPNHQHTQLAQKETTVTLTERHTACTAFCMFGTVLSHQSASSCMQTLIETHELQLVAAAQDNILTQTPQPHCASLQHLQVATAARSHTRAQGHVSHHTNHAIATSHSRGHRALPQQMLLMC